MEHLRSLLLILITLNSPLAAAIGATLASGQVHVAEAGFGVFEMAILLSSIALFLYGLLKTNKSKK